jgi:hypothetical protein
MAERWEPYESRGSRTVLREPEGEVPLGYSPGGIGSVMADSTRKLTIKNVINFAKRCKISASFYGI